jgi:hypothetical protein
MDAVDPENRRITRVPNGYHSVLAGIRAKARDWSRSGQPFFCADSVKTRSSVSTRFAGRGRCGRFTNLPLEEDRVVAGRCRPHG